jgi:hypothetical protein
MRRIELRNEKCKVILRAYENILSIKEFIVLDKKPNNIPPENCRQLKDGRWFVVTEVAIPNSFFYDLFVNQENKTCLNELLQWFIEKTNEIKKIRNEESRGERSFIDEIIDKT